MIVPKEMKLNRFRQVNIPAPKEYFQRFGYQSVTDGRYLGDDNEAPMPMNKIDQIVAGEKILLQKEKNWRENSGNAQVNDVKIDKQNPAAISDTTSAE